MLLLFFYMAFICISSAMCTLYFVAETGEITPARGFSSVSPSKLDCSEILNKANLRLPIGMNHGYGHMT